MLGEGLVVNLVLLVVGLGKGKDGIWSLPDKEDEVCDDTVKGVEGVSTVWLGVDEDGS